MFITGGFDPPPSSNPFAEAPNCGWPPSFSSNLYFYICIFVFVDILPPIFLSSPYAEDPICGWPPTLCWNLYFCICIWIVLIFCICRWFVLTISVLCSFAPARLQSQHVKKIGTVCVVAFARHCVWQLDEWYWLHLINLFQIMCWCVGGGWARALKCICKSSAEFLNLIFQVCQMWTRPNLNFSPKRRPGCGFMSMQSNAFRVGSEIFWDFDTLLIYMSSPGISLSLNVRGRAIELLS